VTGRAGSTPGVRRLLALLLACSTLAIATPGSDAQTSVTPPKQGDQPVQAQVGIYVEEIGRINEGEGTFEVTGYLEVAWQDARLAPYAPEAGGGERTFLEDEARKVFEHAWWPDLEFANAVDKGERMNEELMVAADGHATYRERFHVRLSSRFRMHEFPFDTQQLRLELESFAWSGRDLQLKVKDSVVGFSPEFELPGWTVLGVTERIRDHQEPRDRAPFSELEALITLKRDPGFFIWKFLVPLTVVMLLISGALWIPPDQIKDRVSVTLTGLLTSAAYGFTVTSYLPAHAYDNYLDAVVVFSLVYSSLLTVLIVASYRIHINGRPEVALRLDRFSSFALPLLFLAVLGVLRWVY